VVWGDGDQEDTDITVTRGHLGHRGQLASALREGSCRIEGAESGYGGSIASYCDPLLGKEDGAWEGRLCNSDPVLRSLWQPAWSRGQSYPGTSLLHSPLSSIDVPDSSAGGADSSVAGPALAAMLPQVPSKGRKHIRTTTKANIDGTGPRRRGCKEATAVTGLDECREGDQDMVAASPE
jgi:hypothetical protein